MKAYILTPVGPVFEGDVTGVQMPGINGGFEVRKGHSSLVSLLDIGKLVVRTSDEKVKVYALSGGFTEIKDDVITILAEEAVDAENIDVETEQNKKAETEQEMKEHLIDTAEHHAAEIELRKIKNRIRIARN